MRWLFPVLSCVLLFAFSPVSARGDASQKSHWSTAEINGVQWLIDPDGQPFYSKGVNIVRPFNETAKTRAGQAYCWNNFYPSVEKWRELVGKQLKEWGFNTLGGWSDPSPDLGQALTVDLELGRNARFHWVDPFDPNMERMTIETAKELTAPYRNLPNLIGYFSDNEVGWWNSPLFEQYLLQSWPNHTKRLLWQMIYDQYGGSWDKLLEDWVPHGGADNFESLKNGGAVLKLRPGGNGIRLVDRFLSACTKRYYELMFKGIRAAHPGALYLGDRLPLYYQQDAILSMGDNVDCISTNYNIDVPDGWVAPYFFEGLRKLSGKPVLVSEFFFAAQENRSGNHNETVNNPNSTKPGHLMTVDTQTQRVWGAGNAVLNFARFPNVVGTHWFQYCDEPLGGREGDGEDYNMGLVDTANRPYEELTESFKRLNAVVETIHRTSGRPVEPELSEAETAKTAQGAGPVPAVRVIRAPVPIDVTDQSLIEWDKEHTLLSGFQVEAPHVPFGDVHLAWSPEGFYIFSLSDTFVDLNFLDYKGGFPLSEAFQLHFTVENAGTRGHFAAFLPLAMNRLSPDGFDIHPELYRMEAGKPSDSLPVAGHLQRLNKALPHVAVEAFFPAGWFGLDELRPGMHLKANIALVSYYREFTMTWAGKPGMSEINDPSEFREIVLE